MYEARVVHALSAQFLGASDSIAPRLWDLFVAIGDHWQLGDDPESCRSRLGVFMENRVAISPLHRGYYDGAVQVIEELVAAHGAQQAFEKLFTTKLPGAGVPLTPIEATKRFVVHEFIAMRMALGGFRAFGAVNYNGYMSGANNPDEPLPYRGMGDAP